MTDEQINQRIAEACGWEIFNKPLTGYGFAAYSKSPNGDPSPGIPDYCNDLNAMHEAEEFLSGNLWIGYVNDLANIEGNLFGIRATARQRAEAFLRTLGNWQEATVKDYLTVGDATTEECSVDQKEVQK